MGFVRILICGIAFLAASPVYAQTADTASYPNRPVRVIVPFAPGGITDVIARLWAQRIAQNLGQQFYVENMGGGASNIGMGAAARQPADGYTILAAASSFTINPSLYKKLPYDPFKDFTPVTMLASTPNVLVVHPSLPAKDMQEFITLIRANPGKYSYAMSGTGTPNHLQAELFKLSLNLDLITVPFAGGGPAVQSTVAGHTPIAFTSLTPVRTLVEGGQLRALAVTGTKRSPVWPTVPTMLEAGLKGQEADTFTGLFVPAGTPSEIVDKLYAETAKILTSPDIKQQLDKLGFFVVGNTPAEFSTRIKEEVASWAKIAEDVRIEKQ